LGIRLNATQYATSLIAAILA